MKRSFGVGQFLLLSGILFIGACGKQQGTGNSAESGTVESTNDVPDGAHNSRNALDWNGVYRGLIPCADCEGIETTIVLLSSGDFIRSLKYLGKDDNVFTDRGTFTWNDKGSVVTLEGDTGGSQAYQVGENVLFHLDQQGNRITGDLAENYMLFKARADSRLEGKKWVLTEFMGKPVEKTDGMKEPFIAFDSETAGVSGQAHCNSFSGSYELKEGDRIVMGPNMATTLMACPHMEQEDQFMDAIVQADNYTIAEGVLTLNRAKMTPLMKFTETE